MEKMWAFMGKFTAQTEVLGANLPVLAQTPNLHSLLY